MRDFPERQGNSCHQKLEGNQAAARTPPSTSGISGCCFRAAMRICGFSAVASAAGNVLWCPSKRAWQPGPADLMEQRDDSTTDCPHSSPGVEGGGWKDKIQQM